MRKICTETALLLFLSFALICNAHAQVNLDSGLVAYYPFNGNANDESGNNNNPVFNNAVLTSDYYGNVNSAYAFDGATTYMQIPDSTSLNPSSNTITICVWLKVEGFYTGLCHGNRMLTKADQDFTSGEYLLNFDDNHITDANNCNTATVDSLQETFYGETASTTDYLNPPRYVDKNVWHSLVYTGNSDSATVFLDCKEYSVSIPGPVTFTNGYDLYLGKMNNVTYPYWYNGVLDEVRIYNRILDSAEIAAYSFSCATIMPLVLTSFEGSMLKNQSVLTWTTFDEVNTKSDIIERSYDGNIFSPVGTLAAKGAASTNNYRFIDDPSFANANVYYRIKFIDKDGRFTFSKVIQLALGYNGNSVLKIFPNPSNDFATITFPSLTKSMSQLKIVDATGKIMNVTTVSANTTQATINTQSLSAGIYEIVWVNGSQISNQTLIVK
jgi:hypothetical protein